MAVRRAGMAAFVAVLAGLPVFMAGCAGVSEKQVDAKLTQHATEMRTYMDQRLNASEAETRRELGDVKAGTEQNREVLKTMLTAQMQAIEQERRVLDQLLERLNGAPVPARQNRHKSGPGEERRCLAQGSGWRDFRTLRERR